MIFYFVFVMSIITFIVYGIDKRKAIRGQWRIPEKTLLLLAVLGGSPGAMAGMKIFRHKTQKPRFYIGVPLIFIVECVVSIVVFIKMFS